MTISEPWTELGDLLGARFTRAQAVRAEHGRSETWFAPTPPDAVAYPEDTAEVAEIVRICARHRCPVIAWGAGTSLEGHALAFGGGLAVDFSRMNALVEVSPENMIARVQPGITRRALDAALRDTGLFFPVDPGADASIGGMIATRASGTTTVRYGTMRDNVRALEVVLADGRVIRTGTAARKSSSGYDLTALLVGSEGTLGLVTEATLRLWGRPSHVVAASAAFPDAAAAITCVIETIQLGLPVARIEYLDADSVRAFNAHAGESMDEAPHLLLEFHGTSEAVEEDVRTFGELAGDHGVRGFRWATREEERQALWRLRHNGYYAILALRPGARAIVTDVCVPIAHLAEAISRAEAEIAKAGLAGPILGHAGDGNFHAILLVDPADAEEMARARAVSDRLVDHALALGGTATGEHGVGIGKLDFMAREHGDAWRVMADLKRALDPQNILNPGKVVRLND